jgi:hypothetical protein
MTFLEPHATLLGAWLGADAVATVRHEQRAGVRAVSLFAHDEVVVEQVALEGLAIQRMTARGRGGAQELLEAELAPLAGAAAALQEGDIELTRRAMTLGAEAIERGEQSPAGVPQRAAEILYARRFSGSATITARDGAGTRSAERWSWLDAGELGFWRVRSDGDAPIVRLVAADAGALRDEVASAWAAATAAGARA